MKKRIICFLIISVSFLLLNFSNAWSGSLRQQNLPKMVRCGDHAILHLSPNNQGSFKIRGQQEIPAYGEFPLLTSMYLDFNQRIHSPDDRIRYGLFGEIFNLQKNGYENLNIDKPQSEIETEKRKLILQMINQDPNFMLQHQAIMFLWYSKPLLIPQNVPIGFLYHSGWPTGNSKLLKQRLNDLRSLLAEDAPKDNKWQCSDRHWGEIFLMIGLLGDQSDLAILHQYSDGLSKDANSYDSLNLAKALIRLGDQSTGQTLAERILSNALDTNDQYYAGEIRELLKSLAETR